MFKRFIEIHRQVKTWLKSYQLYFREAFLYPSLMWGLWLLSVGVMLWVHLTWWSISLMVGLLVAAQVTSTLSLGLSLVTYRQNFSGLDESQPPAGLTVYRQFQKDYWFKTIGLVLVSDIYLLMWTLCLLVPGVIKSYAYKQAALLYYDNAFNHQPLSYRACLKQSDQLMKNQKTSYMMHQLSYLKYYLLAWVTLNLSAALTLKIFALGHLGFYLSLDNGFEEPIHHHFDIINNSPWMAMTAKSVNPKQLGHTSKRQPKMLNSK